MLSRIAAIVEDAVRTLHLKALQSNDSGQQLDPSFQCAFSTSSIRQLDVPLGIFGSG